MNTTDTTKEPSAREGFEAQRRAGINVDWFTWQIAWHDAMFKLQDCAATPPQTDGATVAAIDQAIDKLVYTAWYSGEQDGSEGVTWAERGDSYNGMLRDRIQADKKALIALLAATHAPAMAETKLTADDADMVWPDDDCESMFHCIDDAVDYMVDLNWPDAEPVEVTFQLGKRIPNASIRIYNITENGHEWEIVPSGAAASGGELGS
jgi:hypothetical protein